MYNKDFKSAPEYEKGYSTDPFGSGGQKEPKKKLSPATLTLIIVVTVISVCVAFVGGILLGALAPFTPANQLKSDMPYLVEAYRYLKEYYYQDITWEEFEEAAINGMLSNDRFSWLTVTDDYNTPSGMIGITSSRTVYNEYYVSFVHPGSPADIHNKLQTTLPQDRLERGDRIYAVNDVRVEGAAAGVYSAAADLNPLAMKVTFYKDGASDNDGTPRTVTISKTTRLETKNVYYSTEYTAGGEAFGYINFTGFEEAATAEMDTAVSEFVAASGNQLYGSPKKLVLDLRQNGGGSVDVLAKIAPYFIKYNGTNNGLFLMRLNMADGSSQSYESNNVRDDGTLRQYLGDIINGFQLVVLCGSGSASASEGLIANIMYYNPSATIIGDTTYGKGVAQTTIPLGEKWIMYITCATYDVYARDADGATYYWNYHDIGIEPTVNVRYQGAENTNGFRDSYDMGYRNNLIEEPVVKSALQALFG